MKKIVLIYGLIGGSIVGGLMLLTMPLWNSGVLNFDNGELVGYTTMVVALSTIFFGVKSYRDNYNNGVVSFGKAMKIGVLITLIAGVMYALAWEVSFSQMSGDFIAKMTEHRFEEMKASGATEAELQKAREEWAKFEGIYKMPLARFFITIFVEIFPVGVVISLISAGLLRKKQFLPATDMV